MVVPELEPGYEIPAIVESGRLEKLVQDLLRSGGRSPVLHSTQAEAIQEYLPALFPQQGIDLDHVAAELAATAGTYYRKNTHPGMHAYVAGPGLPTDPFAHALVAALNQNVTGYHSAPGATTIERTIIRWFCKLAGLPGESEGLFLGGGSWANLTAMVVAVYQALGAAGREQGIQSGITPVIIAAESVHFSVSRAAMVMGLGQAAIETVPIDSDYRMDSRVLRERCQAVSEDSAKKLCCVIATAGTTAIGAIDPLHDIADLCAEHQVWMHVDAAYGGAALLSPDLRSRLAGIERADSITVDLHKWAYLAFDASMLLYRQPAKAREVFGFQADYARFDNVSEPEHHTFLEMSPEVSRRARAIPAYLAWRHFGQEVLGRNVKHNADCARYLAELVDASDDMELMVMPLLSICCFRYLPVKLKGNLPDIDELNVNIVETLARDGDYLLSPTLINRRPVLRVCICSHKTRASHMEELLVTVRAIGESLL
ncbi:MAG: pyridoxal-dependent decarboxylase [Pseudohongiellaceae bacterium]